MNFRGLIVAVVILAGLGGVLYWSQHRKPPEDNAAASASATPVILKVNTVDVNQLTIKQKQADPVTLQRQTPASGRLPSRSRTAPIRKRLPVCCPPYRG